MTGVSTSCGACKFLRRKCTNECVFAPYFSYDEAAVHFSAVHKVFGASNFSRLLLRLPEQYRSQAAISASYEALARMRDPVYGCVAYIYALQQEVANLQEEIEILGSHLSLANLNPTWVPTDHHNRGSCQASNNFINNNTSSSQPSSLGVGESPMNVLEQWSISTTNYYQEQVVPAHAENNGAYGSNNNVISTLMLPQLSMPICDDLFEISHQTMVEGLLNQDIFDAQRWLVN